MRTSKTNIAYIINLSDLKLGVYKFVILLN